MELIGKGLFSKVYKLNNKQVFIKSVCLVKECLAYSSVNSHYLPRLKVVNREEYICEYYPKVKSLKTSLKPEQYKIYQELRELSKHNYYSNSGETYFFLRNQFEKISNNSVKKSLLHLLDDITNYSLNIGFEISPRNVAVKNGKLILLDIFFIKSQVLELRKQKK